MKKLLLFISLAFLFISLPAYAQVSGGVQQYGPVTAGHCAEWYAPSVVEDSGGSCGGGGGGTINSGTAGQITYYGTTGTTVSGSTVLSITASGLTIEGYNGISIPTADPTSLSIGPLAMPSLATTATGDNVAVGNNALNVNSTGYQNTAVGYAALQSNGQLANTGIGYAAGSQSTGHAVTLVGANAGSTISIGTDEVAVGNDAMDNDDGSGSTVGLDNVAIGVHTLGHLTTGGFNVAVGNESMVGCGTWSGEGSAGCLLTGSDNTGVGQYTMAFIQGAAEENTALGYSALQNLTTGFQNICIGSESCPTITTGSLNVMIGRDVGTSIAATATGILNIGNLITGTGLEQGGAFTPGTVSINGTLSSGALTATGAVLGTVTSSTWNGTSIIPSYGGTGSTALTAQLATTTSGEMDIFNASGGYIAAFNTSSFAANICGAYFSAGGGSVYAIAPSGSCSSNATLALSGGTGGRVSVGSNTPATDTLDVWGGIGLTTTTATVPVNGIYSSSANSLSLTTSGATVLQLTSTGSINLPNITTGAMLCMTASNTLGHCTSGASCLSTCTCTCTAN
jgi:trimeric autotransporter adhesin